MTIIQINFILIGAIIKENEGDYTDLWNTVVSIFYLGSSGFISCCNLVIERQQSNLLFLLYNISYYIEVLSLKKFACVSRCNNKMTLFMMNFSCTMLLCLFLWSLGYWKLKTTQLYSLAKQSVFITHFCFWLYSNLLVSHNR